MYRGDFVIAKRLSDIPLNSPVGVLVDRRRYQAAFLLEEAWENLDRRVKAETNIRLAGESEYRLGGAVIDPSGDL
jgi:hypothetical protein